MDKVRAKLLSQLWERRVEGKWLAGRGGGLVGVLLEGSEVDGELGRIVHCLLS